jgi:aldehyde:ferredoxin oxidoreductase
MKSRYGGYMGKVLQINLTDETISDYHISDRERKLFIGGKTMAAWILNKLLTGKEEALSEDNHLVIMTGPLTGTGAPSTSRFDISTLSPQTGFLTSSNCGGTFGYFLKKAGYDGIILSGKCRQHVWIEIVNEHVAFHDAESLWGRETTAAQEGLPPHTGKIVIGPAGEHLVRYSSIVSGERVAGRAGVGAVLGSKNVKAVTVFGTHDVPIAHPAEMKKHNKSWYRYLVSHPLCGDFLPRLGTAGLVSPMQMRHMLATRNYRYGQYKDFEKVNGEYLAEHCNIRNRGCVSCPMKCARSVMVNGKEVKGPELETLGLLGAGILNNDIDKINEWNNRLDELGMDTISAASTLAWAMEANEKGLWKNGLHFSETDDITKIWDDIAWRKGIGDELAEGSKRLSEKYGGKEFAIHAKGLELAAYTPRGAVGQGLGYAVSNRGGCHLNGGYNVIMEGLGLAMDPLTPHAKADLTMMFQDLMEMLSASGQCLFTSYGILPATLISHPNAFYTKAVNRMLPYLGGVLRLLNKNPLALAIHLPVFPQTRGFELATGMQMTFGQYMQAGERGYNLERYVNQRFGVSAKDDSLAKRLTDYPQDPDKPNSKVPLKRLKRTYYQARGWDRNGLPTRDTLRRLGIIEESG